MTAIMENGDWYRSPEYQELLSIVTSQSGYLEDIETIKFGDGQEKEKARAEILIAHLEYQRVLHLVNRLIGLEE